MFQNGKKKTLLTAAIGILSLLVKVFAPSHAAEVDAFVDKIQPVLDVLIGGSIAGLMFTDAVHK